MTLLKCSATTCMYNQNQLCSKGEIEVLGDRAHSSTDTACGSFREKGTGGFTNQLSDGGCGCEKIQIDCKAKECTYNDNCRCTASAIDIEGHNACNCHDTKCGTFFCH